MIVTSNVSVQFGADGRSRVDASLRLPPDSHIAFYPYGDEPPIVSLSDGTVSVTITVPDRQQVTQADVHKARALAVSFSNYAKELAQVLERQQQRQGQGGAAGGEAA